MIRGIGYIMAVCSLAISAQGVLAADGHAGHGHDMTHGQAANAETAGDPFLLSTDPVSGEKLGPDAVVVSYQGRELRFASKQNAERFQADPKAYLGKVDQQMIEQQKPLYPLATCVVSDEKLDGMGGGVDVIYKNRLVRFCCADCQKEFQKDPAKYVKKIDDAVIKAQKASYPIKECVVTGEALDSMGGGVDYVAGNRLIRFCCSGCIDKFKQNPTAYLQKLGSGPRAAAPDHAGAGHAGHDHH
ncbi:MAG: YHS domain-containing protein [Bacillota bacterium]